MFTCDVLSFSENCYIAGTLYYGNYNITESGKPCQRWDSKAPHEHNYDTWPNAIENYCRSYQHSQPWCYTVSDDSRWENCQVPSCKGEITNAGKLDLYFLIITDSVVLWKIQKFDWLIPDTK